jgi:hypothetical protein
MAKEKTFEEKFVEFSKDDGKLRKLIKNSDYEEIVSTIEKNVGTPLGLKVWSSLLLLSDDEETLLKIIEEASSEENS